MESTARLDYVLFQLTPTRTRCDLVIFAGKSSEKLAYGLLQPFLSHLRAAKDQIDKGGYSITLRPPSAGSGNGSWFTKATLQSFVRFVSTPEVLERFVTIEREIEHIESSIRSYKASNGGGATDAKGNASLADDYSKSTASSRKPKSGSVGSTDDVQDENLKFRLQHVLETRKTVLQKEQAMVFARALAAGFEMDNLGHLISFSDAFGASRLRAACMTFMDLYKKKNEDRLWRDEVAAMQAFPQPELVYTGTSGIILTGEVNETTQNFTNAANNHHISSGKVGGPTDLSLSNSTTSHGSSDINPDITFPTSVHLPSDDAKVQMPFPWAHAPQYPPNFQGPIYQQMPPYHGFVYPGMPYYPGNMQWPPNLKDSVDREADGPTISMPSSKKKEVTFSREPENEDSNDSTELSDSSSESDSSVERPHRRKQGKKSSKKVVIRNINYITSKGDGAKTGAPEADSSDENVYLACGSLKQQVEEAVGSFEKQHRSTSLHKKRNTHLSPNDPSSISADLVTEDELLRNEIDREKKGNGNWDFLQELLVREDTDSSSRQQHSVQAEEEYFTINTFKAQNSSEFDLHGEETRKKKLIPTDPFLVPEKELGNDDNVGRSSFGSFEASEDIRLIPKRDSIPELFLLSQRHEETQTVSQLTSDCAPGSSLVKIQSSDDWIIFKTSDMPTNAEGSIDLGGVDGKYLSPCDAQNENRKEIIDDSFMVQAQLSDDNFNSRLRTDIVMVPDILGALVNEYGSPEVQQDKPESVGFCEPNDLYMVLDRNAAVEQTIVPWNPELDYENNKSMIEASKNHTDGDACVDPMPAPDGKGTINRKTGATDVKNTVKDARAKGLSGSSVKGKPETLSTNRKPALGSRTRALNGLLHKKQEEESRQRKEEVLLRRQKRIAEKSSGIGRLPAMPKKPQSKVVPTSNRVEKPKTQSSLGEESKKATKPVFRSSTIERLAAARIDKKVTTTTLKSGPPKKEASNVNGSNSSRALPIARRAEDSKLNRKKSTNPPNETVSGDVSEVIWSISDVKAEKHSKAATVSSTPEFSAGVCAHDIVEDFEGIKELHVTSSITNGEAKPCFLNGNCSVKLDSIEVDNIRIPEVLMLSPDGIQICGDQGGIASLSTTPNVPESAEGDLGSALTVKNKGIGIRNSTGSPEISEVEESTPPPTNGMSPDPVYSRKKWDTCENSPKANSKGIRKLLMFGRKS
ncbi:COP1-interacting protein 7 [Dionaea muscipula]